MVDHLVHSSDSTRFPEASLVVYLQGDGDGAGGADNKMTGISTMASPKTIRPTIVIYRLHPPPGCECFSFTFSPTFCFQTAETDIRP